MCNYNMNTDKKIIKAKFRYVNDDQKAKFYLSSCVLGISVGQEVHEGELFDITLQLIDKSFISCNILVDDMLQRHTMAMINGGDSEDYKSLAIKNGDLWLQRNLIKIEKLSIPYKIFRYAHWLSHPKFNEYKIKVIDLLKNDMEFKNIFDNTCNKFVDKYCLRKISREHNIEELKYLSSQYLMEECVTYCLLTELACQFKVHPGIRNMTRERVRELLIAPTDPNLLQHVGIQFKNISPFKPQKFEFIE